VPFKRPAISAGNHALAPTKMVIHPRTPFITPTCPGHSYFGTRTSYFECVIEPAGYQQSASTSSQLQALASSCSLCSNLYISLQFTPALPSARALCPAHFTKTVHSVTIHNAPSAPSTHGRVPHFSLFITHYSLHIPSRPFRYNSPPPANFPLYQQPSTTFRIFPLPPEHCLSYRISDSGVV